MPKRSKQVIEPPGPLSPKRGEGEKIAWFSFDFKGIRILDCIEIWVMTRSYERGSFWLFLEMHGTVGSKSPPLERRERKFIAL
jgi:hypothetical protein